LTTTISQQCLCFRRASDGKSQQSHSGHFAESLIIIIIITPGLAGPR
jgi:hypothetical protein